MLKVFTPHLFVTLCREINRFVHQKEPNLKRSFDNYYINTISSILNVINAKEGATVSGKNNIIIHYRFVCNSMQF